MTTLDAHVDRLRRMKERELGEYVRGRLLNQPTEPADSWSHGDSPDRFLMDAYTMSNDDAFQERLKRVVRRLLQAWRPDMGDSATYAGYLIYLVGRLGVDQGPDMLARLAADPAVERILVDGKPLRNRILRALLEFPGQEARNGFWEPLLEDDRYFDTAFLAMTLRGRSEALRYLGRYLDQAAETHLPESAIEQRLSNLITRHLWPEGKNPDFATFMTHVPPRHKARVKAILSGPFPEIGDAATDPPGRLRSFEAGVASTQVRSRVEQGQVERPLDIVLARNGAS